MVQNIYSGPSHNLGCSFRFTCGATECPEVVQDTRPPSCYIDKFRRYQPSAEIWYMKDWDEVNRITWREVFSLQASWIYVLLTIIIVVFIFMSMILIKLLFKIN